jgi:phage terminase large subunit
VNTANNNKAVIIVKLVEKGKLKVYKGAPQDLCTTHKDKVNEDLLEFIKALELKELRDVDMRGKSKKVVRQRGISLQWQQTVTC